MSSAHADRRDAAGVYWRYRTDLDPPFDPAWFDRQTQRDQGWLHGVAGAGRAGARLLCIGGLSLVLRQFTRGGLMRKLVAEHYLFTGLERTRAMREFELLAYCRREHLPAPAPVAARVTRRGLCYRAALLMQRLPGVTLASQLAAELDACHWHRVGCCIRQFHDAGIWHADLNAHNILVDVAGERCHLIDFDRARIRSAGGQRWQPANLARLQRSIVKERAKLGLPSVPIDSLAQWQALMDGYTSAQ